MNVLASALPGLREIRGPVIAGYMWLIFAWVVVGPDLSARPEGEFLGALYDLGTEVGPLGIAAATGVFAYLLGSVSSELTESLLRAPVVHGVLAVSMGGHFGRYGAGEERIRELSRQGQERIEATMLATIHANQEVWLREQEEDLGNRAADAQLRLETELSTPATLLVANQPELFAEVDRIRAEGKLRIAVIPPAIALIIVAAFQGLPLSLLALLPVAVWMHQGVRSEHEAAHLIADAMFVGSVESRAIREFTDWIETL